jgi:hypothetical protein
VHVPDRSPKRIHIVGVSPRTGTTLLAECMVACMNIDAFESHEASVSRLRLGPRVYLTKRPADLFAIGPRLSVDPHFHALCLMRDPRDVIVSRHGKDDHRYWTSLRTWKRRLPVVRARTGHERFLLIRYEDLVADPNGIERRIRERLPFLEAVRPFSAFPTVATPSATALEALGPIRPFDADSVGHWRNHLPRVAGQLAQYGPITDELVEFGYERDASWLSLLDGVTPDRSPSHLDNRSRSGLRRRVERTVLPWISAVTLLAARSTGVRIA